MPGSTQRLLFLQNEFERIILFRTPCLYCKAKAFLISRFWHRNDATVSYFGKGSCGCRMPFAISKSASLVERMQDQRFAPLTAEI